MIRILQGLILKQTHLLIAQVKELFQLDSTVREGTEGTLLLDVSGHLGVGDFSLETHRSAFRSSSMASGSKMGAP
jgi:hypothetical protein